MKAVIVITARYGSSRLEGKVLAKATGKYLVQHTYEQALKADFAQQVLIATDDERVLRACEEFGAACVMTRKDHVSGTDRIAEAVRHLDCEIVVNLQADEPEIDPSYLARAARLLEEHSEADMATLVAPFETAGQVSDPNIVKCVTDARGRAIYFSRSVIPYDRQCSGIGPVVHYKRHLGLYAYRKPFLVTFTHLAAGVLEQIEKLEQLRALENGYRIRVIETRYDTVEVDTAEDLEKARGFLLKT